MDEIIIKEIQEKYDTPAYVFDINVLRDRIGYLKEKLTDRIELCYAIKANAFVVKEIEDIIDRFEVCSPGEYRICEEKKIDPKKILISGVYKTPKVIKEMINTTKEMNCYTIESMEQFELLKDIKSDIIIPVMIRITSGSQFGVNEEEAIQIIANRNEYKNLYIKGIQYFSGTQKNSIKRPSKEIEYLDDFIKRMKQEYDFEVDELEYGGGFPIHYFVDSNFDEEAFLNDFVDLINNMEYKGRIILELGRSIVANCGYYLTRVVDKKKNKGQNYAIVDGGMNHIVYYGQSMAMKIPICEIYPKKDNYDESWNLCGSLCTTNDILVKQFPAGDLQIGDILIFKNTGAYCMTEGISLFLSRDLPYIFKVYDNHRLELVRENVPTYRVNM